MPSYPQPAAQRTVSPPPQIAVSALSPQTNGAQPQQQPQQAVKSVASQTQMKAVPNPQAQIQTPQGNAPTTHPNSVPIAAPPDKFWFFPQIATRGEAEAMLQRANASCFLVRSTTKDPNQYILSLLLQGSTMARHVVIDKQIDGSFNLLVEEAHPVRFPSLEILISYVQQRWNNYKPVGELLLQ
jgi:hypothetical protein